MKPPVRLNNCDLMNHQPAALQNPPPPRPDVENVTARPPRRVRPWRKFIGAIVPNWLMRRSEVSQGAKLAYARLAQYEGKDGECFPKQTTLAAELGVSERTAHGYIHELIESKLIGSHRPGLGRSNRYFFLDHPWIHEGRSEVPSASGQQRQKPSTPVPQIPPGQDRLGTSAPIIKENQVHGEPEIKDTPPISPCEGDAESILQYWNSFPELLPATTITKNRARKIRKRLADPWWRQHWRQGIERLAKSNFAKDGGSNGWRPTFDWFLGGDSLTKILEGNYDNRRRPTPIPLPSDVKAQIKAVDDLIASHPANDQSASFFQKATEAQEEDLQRLVGRREELLRQLAGVSCVAEQPGDDYPWWTRPLDELRNLFRAHKHLGNDKMATRLAEIITARESKSPRS